MIGAPMARLTSNGTTVHVPSVAGPIFGPIAVRPNFTGERTFVLSALRGLGL